MKTSIISGIIIILLLSLPACAPANQIAPPDTAATPPDTRFPGDDVIMINLIPIPTVELPFSTGVEAPDDIVFTPGGYAYRANVHETGMPDKWPPIPFTEAALKSSAGILNISYRSSMETKAGETRNNIIMIYAADGLFNKAFTLYAVDVPAGIKLTRSAGGGRPGMLLAVLMIAVSPDIAPGEHTFKIGIELDGDFCGTLPCAVRVTE